MAGPANVALVRQADVDPAHDAAGRVEFDQVRRIFRRQALAKAQRIVGVERECQQSNHHALIGFGGMPRQGQVVRLIIVPVQVGDLQFCLADGGFQGHGDYKRIKSANYPCFRYTALFLSAFRHAAKMFYQSAALKRCATCQRWAGLRSPGAEAGTVELQSESETGLCTGGPWDGTERRVRSACGHWVIWPALANTTPTTPDTGN